MTAPTILDKYARAVVSLTTAPLPRELFETCEHFTPIAQECNACEPTLDHDPGFDEAGKVRKPE
jgi:hypothetical protein